MRWGAWRGRARPPAERPADGARAVYLGRGRLLVRAAWGGWMVAPSDNLDILPGLVRDGIIEPATTRLVRELLRPGQAMLNGGASFGYYAVLGAGIVGAAGRVIAVEANPHIVPFLMLTRHWSGYPDRIDIRHRALWDSAGETIGFAFDPQLSGGGRADATLAVCDVPAAREAEEALWSPAAVARIEGADGFVAPTAKSLVPFAATTARIDDIVPAGLALDLILLDVEGAEAFALRGAAGVVARSPGLRIVFEWSAATYRHGSAALRAAFAALWDELAAAGWRVRQIDPTLAADGGLIVSAPLDFAAMTEHAVHGTYVWLPPAHDPWG